MSEPDHAWDVDIASLALGDVEKNGLQVFRNYKNAFDRRLEQTFIDEADGEGFDFGALDKVVNIIAVDDFRMIAVVACSYADELLRLTFDAAVPSEIPGGKKNFLGPMGPVSSFAKRLQLAHAFDLISPDLILDWDKVRSVRNKISHAWEIDGHSALISEGPVAGIFPVETMFTSKVDATTIKNLSDVSRFRLRLIWLCGRLTYEFDLYQRARRARVDPDRTLYGSRQTNRLKGIVATLMPASKAVLDGSGTVPV